MHSTNRILIAYACENKGSESGVGYYWTKTIAGLNKNGNTILITRKNNNTEILENELGLTKIGIDLPNPLLKIKKIFGIRVYYIFWSIWVTFYLLKHYKKYKSYSVHHITFTPIYYPPIYFLLPYKFLWGPCGGGERFPLSYLFNLKLKDFFSESLRLLLCYSIYINPLFYLGCLRAQKIICSTYDTSILIPKAFRNKISIELMVMDSDKVDIEDVRTKTIVIANRLIGWKMTHLFIEAFYEFQVQYKSDYKLIIIGNGPYLKKVEPWVDKKNIIHYRRFKVREDMLNILKRASLFVSMSIRDSGAASLLEAISYNIPFLVTNSGAHATFIAKNIGFSFKLSMFKKDKEKIISILKRILQDDECLLIEQTNIKNVYQDFFCEKAKLSRIENILFK